jgi:predicted enzyme related to lactoylglutathione lyase
MDCRLSIVRVFVRDWPRALRFYNETLGIPLTLRNDELGWAQLATGQAQLALERLDPGHDEGLTGRFLAVSLAVADVDATYETLFARGVDFLAPPEQMAWGGVLAHFRDPDGNVLTLVGPPRHASSPA